MWLPWLKVSYECKEKWTPVQFKHYFSHFLLYFIHKKLTLCSGSMKSKLGEFSDEGAYWWEIDMTVLQQVREAWPCPRCSFAEWTRTWSCWVLYFWYASIVRLSSIDGWNWAWRGRRIIRMQDLAWKD